MNNKGFAISTMLYGLSIVGLLLALLLVQTLSTNRFEQTKLVKDIEDDIVDYDTYSPYFSYDNMRYHINPAPDDGKRSVQLPFTGWYKVELWGAADCVDPNSETTDPLEKEYYKLEHAGNYTSVNLYFKEGTKVYIQLGKNIENKCNHNDSQQKTILASSQDFGDYIITDSTQIFDPERIKNKVFVDNHLTEDEYVVENTFTRANKHSSTNNNYIGTMMNLNEYGRARITLVSTQIPKKYISINNPGASSATVPAKNGVYYIIDPRTGSALTYQTHSKQSEQSSSESLEFKNLDGSNEQKWKYNNKLNSFVNIRSNFSLKANEKTNNATVFSDSEFLAKANEKWIITFKNESEIASQSLIKYMKTNDSTGAYEGAHPNKKYIINIDSSSLYLYHAKPAQDIIKVTSSSTDNNIIFYVINAY